MSIARDRLLSITDDSTAQTSSDTLVGDKFIDITSGTSAGHLMPGGELAYKSSGALMARLDLSQFQQQMHMIELLLDDIDRGKSPLGAFIKGDAIYSDLLRKVAELQRCIHVAADTTTAVGQALYTDTLYRQITQPLRQLDHGLAQHDAG